MWSTDEGAVETDRTLESGNVNESSREWKESLLEEKDVSQSACNCVLSSNLASRFWKLCGVSVIERLSGAKRPGSAVFGGSLSSGIASNVAQLPLFFRLLSLELPLVDGASSPSFSG